MNEFRGGRRSGSGQVTALYQEYGQAASGGITCDAHSIDPASDN
jgi:hypothetical protein